jgi:O-succinylbenzoate synthase
VHIDGIELRLLTVPLKTPFATSYGTISERSPLIVRVFGEGYEGWAECPADVAPTTERNPVGVAWSALEYRLSQQVLGLTVSHPLELKLDSTVPRSAVAALEMAVWDLHAKVHGLPLWHVLGGIQRPVASGVVVGIPTSIEKLIDAVGRRVDEGYQRVKLKIKPGWDSEPVAAVHAAYPDLAVSVDANGAYSADDFSPIRALDALRLRFIEQPFAPPDIEQHALLAESLATPICLDESLPDRNAVMAAINRNADFVINAKPARLGGHVESLAVHRLAVDAGTDLWCGGYLETGIGRAHLIALSTLPGFTMPGDVSASGRYWDRDLIEPEWTLLDGALHPTSRPGIGVDVNSGILDKSTIRRTFLEV